MPVKEIILIRHGHRIAWTLDPAIGEYRSSIPFPTKLPADPPLASHGVEQAEETGKYLERELGPLAKQDRLRVYSSLFYRCPETLRPTVERLRATHQPDLMVRGETGFGEWFGKAWFEQPAPLDPASLKSRFYEWIDPQYQSKVVPDRHGERIHALHDRLAKALDAVIRDVDEEYEKAGRGAEEVTILLCGHAAPMIATGRTLTGKMPEDPDTSDFKCYTCGITKFRRRQSSHTGEKSWSEWRTNGGVAGGWDCVLNSWCGHLSRGEERGWHFHGDESFDSYGSGMVQTHDGGVPDKPESASGDRVSKL